MRRPGIGGVVLDNLDAFRRAALRAHASPALPTGGGELWVSPTGEDENPGSFDAPIRTIYEGFLRSEQTLNLMPGRYDPATLRGRRKRLRAPEGGVSIANFGPALAGASFTLADGLWVAPLTLRYESKPQRILSAQEFGADGYERRLRRYASLPELKESRSGWFFDPEKKLLYIAADRRPTNYRALYTDDGDNTGLFVEGGELIVDGEITFDGVGVLASPLAGVMPLISLRGCTIQFAFSNFYIEGGFAYLEGVRSYASRSDCFGYTSAVGQGSNLAIEIDCRASCAGDLEGLGPPEYPNCNASSAHGKFDIARLGGVYERSYGPDVADAGQVGGEAFTWNVGITMRGSALGIGYGLYAGDGPHRRVAWLDTCWSDGALVVANRSVVKAFESRFIGATLEGDGEQSTFDPQAP